MERSLSERDRSKRIEQMLQFYMPRFRIPSECEIVLDELLAARNRLTHELILIGDLGTEDAISASATEVSLERVDQYFLAVEELIMASITSLTRNQNEST